MSFPIWLLIIGGMMIAMALSGSVLKRLPLSASMLYLAVGFAMAKTGWLPNPPDPLALAPLFERITEAALLISLFCVGLKLGLPLWGRRWQLPLRLALLSMIFTVALIAAGAYFVFGFPLSVAIILGGILSPTDPVLASDVQVDHPTDHDRLKFSLTGEGALNDGAAFPFVFLGLGMMDLHNVGNHGWRWVLIDCVWGLAGGLLVGFILGWLISRLVLYLRTYHNEAVGLDEFIGLGLVALAYGTALLLHASGFLAVFAAGLALQKANKPLSAEPATDAKLAELKNQDAQIEFATHPESAGIYMTQTVRRFNEQLERIAELAIVLLVGLMLPHARFDLAALALALYVFVVVRPVSVWAGLWGTNVNKAERFMMSWFGIRGIGSMYYVMYAINQGLDRASAIALLGLTLTTIAISVVVHGISVTPLMKLYTKERPPR